MGYLSRVALTVALALAALAGVRAKASLDRNSASSQALAPTVLRAGVVDALIGRDVSLALRLLRRKPVHFAASQREAVVWYVEVAACPGCLANPSDWLVLAAQPSLDAFLVIGGLPQAAAERSARAVGITRGAVGDPDRSIRAMLGDVLPDTGMLVSPGGVVLLADSRYAGQSCAWTFFQQVAAVRGWTDGRMIRKDGPSGDYVRLVP